VNPGAPVPLVLLLEDEWLIATTVAEALTQHGCRVLGPVPTIPLALALLEESRPDVAIIDYRLAEETTEAILPVLDAAGVAVCVLTGYTAAQLPARYASYRFLEKPFRLRELFLVVDELASQGHSAR
jgi:DNA-binding response OmpR family regulator